MMLIVQRRGGDGVSQGVLCFVPELGLFQIIPDIAVMPPASPQHPSSLYGTRTNGQGVVPYPPIYSKSTNIHQHCR